MNKELEVLQEIRNKVVANYQCSTVDEVNDLFIELKQALQDKDNEIQKLKIDNYQQKNLINKYHNKDFPQLRHEITVADDKLDRIEEVLNYPNMNHYGYNKIKSIIKESE